MFNKCNPSYTLYTLQMVFYSKISKVQIYLFFANHFLNTEIHRLSAQKRDSILFLILVSLSPKYWIFWFFLSIQNPINLNRSKWQNDFFSTVLSIPLHLDLLQLPILVLSKKLSLFFRSYVIHTLHYKYGVG